MLTFTPLLRMIAAMSSNLTDQLRQAYKNVLLQISFDLDQEHRQKLRRCCTGLISTQHTETVTIFRCLEHEGKISWEDVSFLRDTVTKMRRFDIVKKLTVFGVKRDLTILLDFYARRRQGLDLCCCSVSVKRVAGYLRRIAEIVRDGLNVASLNITVESGKDMRKALVDFQEEIDCRELTFSWNEFTILVVIAGELVTLASTSEERRAKRTSEERSDSVMELCSTAADELCSRLIELGSWVSGAIFTTVCFYTYFVLSR